MSAASTTSAWSPSVNTALLWASGFAALGGEGTVTDNELFLGLFLAHPDPRGEVWQFLSHFGLTVRDLLEDDYPVIDGTALGEAAAAARGPDPTDWNAEVSSILADAAGRAGGTAQVLHVLAELLAHTPWQSKLQSGLTRFGISASELIREFNDVVPSLGNADSDSADDAAEKINLSSSTPAGEQIGQWLSRRFPRRPATVASFSNDEPDPGADFVGVSEEADAFAYLIASSTLIPPLAIGLFGVWGSGKSFLMAKIRQRVSQLAELAALDGGGGTANGIWANVVPVDFNAWQYVETDLWAALLSRIFDELTPEARRKLTELSRQQQELHARQDENLSERNRAESKVAELLQNEASQAQDVRKAAERLERVDQQVTALRDAAVRAALNKHARLAATTVPAGVVGSDLEPVAHAFNEARRLTVAAEASVWRQGEFWTIRRSIWVILALFIVPILLVVLGLGGVSLPTALIAALGSCAALLFPVLRAAADFVEGQQKAALDAAETVEQELSSVVRKAEEDTTQKRRVVEETRRQILEEQHKAETAETRRVDLDTLAARLNAGSVYAEFISNRNTSDDYRKRLGVVTTVRDDLEALSKLVADYNITPAARLPNGPPNRIVLYIDDLDRCPPARVLEVLEAVHLLLAFPLFVVVVAVDTRWLKAALTKVLPMFQERTISDSDAPTATDYLEKIFQIPFWVEPLDDYERQRLLRGLLLPSVAQRDDMRPSRDGIGVQVGDREREAADKMLAAHGPWLDRDAQGFTISPGELAFVESLTPLVTGTPRQVKRFVNVCKLLLAMTPPLAGGDGPATERKSACFMAAVHQSMPTFAAQLAAAAASSEPTATLETILSDLRKPESTVARQRIQEWLRRQPPALPPCVEFSSAAAPMLIKRWAVIRRLRFAENELIES